MKNLVSAVATATLATALAGCVTNPSKQDTDNGPNAPRALGSTSATESPATASKTVPSAALKWNVESCNKDGLTPNTLNTKEVCVRIIESGVSTSANPASSRPNLKSAMPGTKNASANAASAASQTSGPATAYALQVTLSECGAANTASNLFQSATDLFGGITDKLGAAAKAAANRQAGGGIAGRAAGEATTAATQRGKTTATNTQQTLSDACTKQITNFINDDFKPAIAGLSKAFGEAHPGYKAVYTVSSELPEVHNKALQLAAGQTVPTRALGR